MALIDRGRIIALDTPYGLAEKVTGGKQVRFVPSKPFDDQLPTLNEAEAMVLSHIMARAPPSVVMSMKAMVN